MNSCIQNFEKKLYLIESERVAAIINGSSVQEIETALNTNGEEIMEDVTNKLIHSVRAVIKLVSPIYFSSEFLNHLISADSSSLGNPISEKEFCAARDFVESCLKANLSKVQWLHLENQFRSNAEGFCISHRDEEHFIFTQDDPFGVKSTDLLVHELGHAADHTVSRSRNDDSLLIRHITLCEAVAYYCQYQYLSEFGTQAKRHGSLGPLCFLYLCIATVRYCLKKNLPLSDFDPEVDIDDSEFNEIIDSYNKCGINGREYICSILNESVKPCGSLTNLVFNQIAPKFGIVLAILLLDCESDLMIELINENTVETDIDSILHKFIPDYYIQINSFETLALKYINNA